jgi:biopolymer transport protein TolQ
MTQKLNLYPGGRFVKQILSPASDSSLFTERFRISRLLLGIHLSLIGPFELCLKGQNPLDRLTFPKACATFDMKMNILKLITQASIVVQVVLLILLFFSVFSWAVIFFKRNALKAANSQSKKFLQVFRRSQNLSDVNEAAKKFRASPLAALFQSGFKDLNYHTRSNPGLTSSNLESINRALLKAANTEISRLERMMSFLATTGSVTPFIGLFGTVWGIMDAFNEIGIAKSASLVTVAPGIAEALIATALGLFAAIPAVIAYNHYLHKIKDITARMEDFSIEFLNIAERLYGV